MIRRVPRWAEPCGTQGAKLRGVVRGGFTEEAVIILSPGKRVQCRWLERGEGAFQVGERKQRPAGAGGARRQDGVGLDGRRGQTLGPLSKPGTPPLLTS